jgi:hypothetical protein
MRGENGVGDVSEKEILETVIGFIRRFVVLTEAQAIVIAIWVIHTHVFQAAETTPYLAITSAEKRSGKTRLLEVLNLLVANPWQTGRVTAAVLTRKIDAQTPTLLLDESDAAFQGERDYAEALRGILNSGHRRGGVSSLCVGKGLKVTFRDFSTFCPKALAGIGKLPDTVTDRSIPIRLKRKAQGEGEVERFRLRLVQGEARSIQVRIEVWARKNLESLQDARPDLPEILTDRQQDGVEPLLSIADALGWNAPDRARKALFEVFNSLGGEDSSVGVNLLGDIRRVFGDRGNDRATSHELISDLIDIETSPWAEWNHGRPLSPASLSRLLRPFEISPRTIRIDEKTLKGYLRDSFEEAWKRYLTPGDLTLTSPTGVGEPSHSSQLSINGAMVEETDSSHDVGVTSCTSLPWSELTDCVTDVTVQKPPAGYSRGKGTGEAAARKCSIHPLNKADYWLRGLDEICGLCHPRP